MPMHYWGGDAWGGWMILHGIFWLLLLAILVIGVIALVRSSGSARSKDKPSSALDVLAERYARGEIDRDEYLQRKRDILEP